MRKSLSEAGGRRVEVSRVNDPLRFDQCLLQQDLALDGYQATSVSRLNPQSLDGAHPLIIMFKTGSRRFLGRPGHRGNVRPRPVD